MGSKESSDSCPTEASLSVIPNGSSAVQSIANNTKERKKIQFLDLPDEIIGDHIAAYLFEEVPFLLNLSRNSRADLCRTRALSLYLSFKYDAPFLEGHLLDESFLCIEQSYIRTKGKLDNLRGFKYFLLNFQIYLGPSELTDTVILSMVAHLANTKQEHLFDFGDFKDYVMRLVLRKGGLAFFFKARNLFYDWRGLLASQPDLSELFAKWFDQERSALFDVLFEKENLDFQFEKFFSPFIKARNTFIPTTLCIDRIKPIFTLLAKNAVRKLYGNSDFENIPNDLIFATFIAYVEAHENEIDPKHLRLFNYRYNPTFQVSGPMEQEDALFLVAAGRYEDAIKFFVETSPKKDENYSDFQLYPDFIGKLIERISPERYRQFFDNEFPKNFSTNPEAIPLIFKVMEADSVLKVLESWNYERIWSRCWYQTREWLPLFVLSAGGIEDFRAFMYKSSYPEDVLRHIFSFNADKPVHDYLEYLEVYASVTMQREGVLTAADFYYLNLKHRLARLKFMVYHPVFRYCNHSLNSVKASADVNAIVQSQKNRISEEEDLLS